MPKILWSNASPYSAKVRMAALAVGFDCESVAVDTNAEPDLLMANNPLGKIPVLILDDGEALFDSRTITHWLDRQSKGALFPRNAARRTEAERLEALSDGVCDCLLAHVYERRFRPAEKIHQPWLDKQWSKALRGLDHLDANAPKLGRKPNAGQLALRALLGYAALRFSGQWEKGRGRLTRWAKAFDRKFPELAALLPK